MPENDLLRLTANIVAAHVANNTVHVEGLLDLIRTVHAALAAAVAPAKVEIRLVPAVSIKKSVFPDYLVCLEDGKKMSVLTRHLSAAYGMTPDDYRAKWGLPKIYPMVAASYRARRAALAKEFGLGTAAPATTPEPTPVKPEVVVQRILARKRGRKPGSKNRAA